VFLIFGTKKVRLLVAIVIVGLILVNLNMHASSAIGPTPTINNKIIFVNNSTNLSLPNVTMLKPAASAAFLNSNVIFVSAVTTYGSYIPGSLPLTVGGNFMATTIITLNYTDSTPIFLNKSYFKEITNIPGNINAYEHVTRYELVNTTEYLPTNTVKYFTDPATNMTGTYNLEVPVTIPLPQNVSYWQSLNSNQIILAKGINLFMITEQIKQNTPYNWTWAITSADAVAPSAIPIQNYNYQANFNSTVMKDLDLPASVAISDNLTVGSTIISPASVSLYDLRKITSAPITTLDFDPLAITGTVSNTLADSGQYETITASISGGTSPYTVNFFNVTGSETAWSIGYRQWLGTSAYPTGTYAQSCVAYSNSIYCIGGYNSVPAYTSAVYYAPILNTGPLGSWASSANTYPISAGYQSCVTYSNDIYCIGGYNNHNSYFTSVYYAPIFSNGTLGSWTGANSYPISISEQSCATYSNNIYCVAGGNSNGVFKAVYYAPILSSGTVGSWTSTTSYPINVSSQSCATYSNDIYCVGGAKTISSLTAAVYYAPILSSGLLGSWASSNSYPTNIRFHSCAAFPDSIYCIGGYINALSYTSAVYYAPIFSNGAVGSWQSTTKYLTGTAEQSCTTYQSGIYCVAGVSSSAVYYAPISAQGIANTLNYTFRTGSPTNSNTFTFNIIVTDAVANTANSVQSTFTVNIPLATPTISPSRATMLYSGQVLNISSYETGGTPPYTYNFIIYNSTNNTIIANQLGASSTFLATTNSLWITNSPVSAYVTVTDSATTKATVNSINTPYITIAPDLNITNSSALINLLTNYTYWQSIGYNTVNLTLLNEANITINMSGPNTGKNWNGYYATANSGVTYNTVKDVYASWRVQQVTMSNTFKSSLQWIGIGGGNIDHGLIQVGTASLTDQPSQYPGNYFAWYELMGNGLFSNREHPICGLGKNISLPVPLGICAASFDTLLKKVEPNDFMDAYIVFSSNLTNTNTLYGNNNLYNNNDGLSTQIWLVFINDLTQHWMASGYVPYQSNESTADFISEDPVLGSTLPYANYNISQFGNDFASYSKSIYNGVSIPGTLVATIVVNTINGNWITKPVGKLPHASFCIGANSICNYTVNRLTPDNSSFWVTGSNLSISMSTNGPITVGSGDTVHLTTTNTGSTGSDNLTYEWYTATENFTRTPVEVDGSYVHSTNLTIAVTTNTIFAVFVTDNSRPQKPVAYNYTIVNVTQCGASPANILYCIPITLNSIATLSSGWQFNITLPNDYILYSNYFNSSYRNGEFYYGNGTLIDSYLIGTRPNMYIIKLDNQLNAEEPQNIYFGFAASNTYSIWDCNTIGEAPQISSTYASCDSGMNIFNNYQNFNGTSCPSGWSCDNVTVDNGIRIPVGDPSFIISNQTFAPANGLVLDFYTPQLISEGDGRCAGDFLAGFMAGTADTSSGNDFTGIYQNACPLVQNYYVSSQIGNTLYDNSLPVTGYENFAGFVSIYTTHNNITEASNFQTYNITLNELPQDTNLHIGFGGLSQKYGVGLNNYISWVGTRDGPATNNGIVITNPVQFTFGSLLNVS
jgi:hypothetical protein